MNAESLLYRLKQGDRLSSEELRDVRDSLADPTTSEDKYTLIHVLWKARDMRGRGIIGDHLLDADDMVRRIALQAMTDLSPSDEVFESAVQLARDPSPYVRMAAATSIGTLGARLLNRTAEAARLLLSEFEHRHRTGDPEWEIYYGGLLDLTQVPYQARPLATRDLRAEDVDPDVIAEARAMARRGSV